MGVRRTAERIIGHRTEQNDGDGGIDQRGNTLLSGVNQSGFQFGFKEKGVFHKVFAP